MLKSLGIYKSLQILRGSGRHSDDVRPSGCLRSRAMMPPQQAEASAVAAERSGHRSPLFVDWRVDRLVVRESEEEPDDDAHRQTVRQVGDEERGERHQRDHLPLRSEQAVEPNAEGTAHGARKWEGEGHHDRGDCRDGGTDSEHANVHGCLGRQVVGNCRHETIT